jgi:hypothetical protein
MHCRRRPAQTTSSFQYIESPVAQRSRRPTTWRRHPASQRCAYRGFINGLKPRTKAASSPTDRVSLTYGEMFYLDSSRSSRSRGKPSHTVRGPGSAANPRCPWSCLNGPPNHLPHQTTCPRSPRARDLLCSGLRLVHRRLRHGRFERGKRAARGLGRLRRSSSGTRHCALNFSEQGSCRLQLSGYCKCESHLPLTQRGRPWPGSRSPWHRDPCGAR